MNKSHAVHYMNKYPGSQVRLSDDGLDVHCKGGKYRVALRKNGAGQWVDMSDELGCIDRHDLAPIPKNARVMKLFSDGKIGPSEEAAEREPVAAALAEHAVGGYGKVPSIKDLELAKEAFEPGYEGQPWNRSWKSSK